MKKKPLVVKVEDWAHADIRDCVKRIDELTGELQAKEETLQKLFKIINRTHRIALRIWKEVPGDKSLPRGKK